MKNVLNKHLNFVMCSALTLLILFGFYKNGIFLYTKKYITFIQMFRPLLIVLMSIAGAVIGSFICERRKYKKINLDYFDTLKQTIIESAILACMLPINTSPLILFVITLVAYIPNNKISISRVALLFLIISALNRLLGINIYENAYELSTELNYNRLDLFIGLGSGGIASTNVFLILLSLTFLSLNKLYKKDIAIFSIITFTLLTLGIAIITNNYTGIFKMLFSYNIMFALVFVAPNTISSCYTIKGQILSSIIIGILTVILSYYIPYEAVFVAVLFISLIKNIIDRVYVIL